MQISFNKKNRTFRLDTENVSYAMMIGPSGELRHLYYGAALVWTSFSGAKLAGRPGRGALPFVMTWLL